VSWHHSRTRGRFPGRRYVSGDPLIRAAEPMEPQAEALTPQKLILLRFLASSAEPPATHEVAACLGIIPPFALDVLAECAVLGLLVFGEEGRPVLTPLGRAAARNPREAA
jgi:hypothetical protein